MIKWLPYPMVRIALFFIGGLLLGIYFPEFVSFKLAISLIIFCVAGFFFIKFYSKKNQYAFVLGFLGLLAIFSFGFVRSLLFNDSRNESHISKIDEPIQYYQAIVRSVPEEKPKSWKVEIEVTSVKTKNWQPASGKILLYISKENFLLTHWHYGDKILVRGNPHELKPPLNPGEFNFKQFLSFKNVSHLQFAHADEVKFISSSRKGFIHYSHQARAWSMEKINEYIQGTNERAIAIALILGVTDGIDNDLQNAYAASGAMHVLAVSGMHVGIIYAIILFLFKPLKRFSWSKWLVAIVSLILLWSFAFVTGLSPSVLRAVTMFTFIALARPFERQTNIYNTLAASVFVLLIYNPYLIMSVGFQLSYLAVLGIVYLQKPIYNLWEIENTAGDWVWKMTCVSIAAQIATFALGLFYFHQFPTYFLISNLLVIPLSTFVLVIGIFLLAFSFIPPIATATAMILEGLIKALNWTVFKTEALPFSLINNIQITAVHCWLLMGILVSFILFFEFKSMKWFYVLFGLGLVFVFFQWYHFLSAVDRRQLIVYQINNHHAFELIDRGRSYFNRDSSLLNDQERIKFHIYPNRLYHQVERIESMTSFAKQVNGINYFQVDNKTIGWIDKHDFKFPTNAQLDFIIVSRNSLPKNVLSEIKVNKIIFDGSNTGSYVKLMIEELTQRNIETYSTAEEGAYIF